MKKKIQIFRNALYSIQAQFIGNTLSRYQFICFAVLHYLFKTVGFKSIIQFPAAKFRYQNVVLQTRPNTIDFWACLESYEPDLTHFLINVLKDKKETFIDVGGHIGRFTTLMAKNEWNVITFEPIQSNYQALIKNLEYNNCADNAEVFNIGLGDKNQTQTIYFDPEEMGEASLVNINKSANEEIQIVRFDDFMQGKTFGDFIVVKIDIEGNEEKAMDGMKNFINSYQPLLVIELWNDHSKNLISFLKSIGYRQLHIFWFVESEHSAYMDEMYRYYNHKILRYDYK